MVYGLIQQITTITILRSGQRVERLDFLASARKFTVLSITQHNYEVILGMTRLPQGYAIAASEGEPLVSGLLKT
jgi:hypothetical protein